MPHINVTLAQTLPVLLDYSGSDPNILVKI